MSSRFFMVATLAAISLAPALVRAQDGTGFNIHDHLLIRDKKVALYGSPGETYEGSPYLDDTFQPATVHTPKQRPVTVSMRYHIAEDAMEFVQGGQTFYLEPDPRLSKIQVGQVTFVVDQLKAAGNSGYGYFELMSSGKLTLLARKAVNYRQKIVISDVPAKYSRAPDQYYFKVGGGAIQKFSQVRKLIDELPEKKEEVRQFIESQKISLKDRDDLLKLAMFYNTGPSAE